MEKKNSKKSDRERNAALQTAHQIRHSKSTNHDETSHEQNQKSDIKISEINEQVYKSKPKTEKINFSEQERTLLKAADHNR